MRRFDPLRRIFSLDLRSLALFRIGLALVSLYDVVRRWPGAEAFLSDAGFFSRSQYLQSIHRPWSLSLYFVVGEPIQVQGLLLLQGLISLGVLLGWRTRWCLVPLWVLAGSVINRNPLAINGGDTLFTAILFWAMFLPLGVRWSLDARRRATAGLAPAEDHWTDWAGVGLILQLVILYWSTVALKSDPVWWNGQAIGEAMKLDLMVKPLGHWLAQFPGLLAVLTWATVAVEWIGPALLLWPRGQAWLRPLVILAFVGLHLGIFFTMEVELFGWVCITAWVALLPTSFWERRWVRRLTAFVSRARSDEVSARAPLDLRMPPLARLACVVTLGFVLLWVSRPVLPDEIEEQITHDLRPAGRLLRLRQNWSMFAPRPPRTDGWFVLRARQANGNEIDLLAAGTPLTWDKPACASSAFPGRRWTKYLSNIGKGHYRELRGPFCDYLIGQWNTAHDVGRQVVEAELYYLKEWSDRPEEAPDQRRLWYRRNIEPTL